MKGHHRLYIHLAVREIVIGPIPIAGWAFEPAVHIIEETPSSQDLNFQFISVYFYSADEFPISHQAGDKDIKPAGSDLKEYRHTSYRNYLLLIKSMVKSNTLSFFSIISLIEFEII
jgi:hypothetical protein